MTNTSARIHQKAIKTIRKKKRGFPVGDNVHFENVSDCWKVFPQRFITEMKCDELSKYHLESKYRDTCFSFDEYIESISNKEQRKSLIEFYRIYTSGGITYTHDKKDPRFFIFHDNNTDKKTKIDVTKSIPLHVKLIMANDMALFKMEEHQCRVRKVYIHNPTNTEVSVEDFNDFTDKQLCRSTRRPPIGFEDFPDIIGRVPAGSDPREIRDSIKECIDVRVNVMSNCWSACSKNINTIRGHYLHLFKMIILGYIFDRALALKDFE